MKNCFLTLVFIAFVVVCKSQDYTQIGEAFDHKAYVTLQQAMNDETEEEVIVKAKVNAVCQAKGCWMTLSDESMDAEVFVKFKDYAFFMPMDLAGGEVIAKGLVTKEFTPVEELRHYAEDEGKSKKEIEAITEPKEEYKMMASGVVILR